MPTTTVTFAPVPQPLLDDPGALYGTKEFALTFPGVGNDAVGNVTVTFSTTHTSSSDNIVYLISPLGRQVVLYGGQETSPYDPGFGMTLDDAAGSTLDSYGGGTGGTFKPWEPLSEMQGQRISGTWKVLFADMVHGDTGDLESLSLTITDGGTPHALPSNDVPGDILYLTDASLDSMATPVEARKLDSIAPGAPRTWFSPADEIWPMYYGGGVVCHPNTGQILFELGVWFGDPFPERWSTYPNDYALFLTNTSGTWDGVRRLTFMDVSGRGEHLAGPPSFSPDGAQIALSLYLVGMTVVDLASEAEQNNTILTNLPVEMISLTYGGLLGLGSLSGTYYYKVTALGSVSGESLPSNEISVTTTFGTALMSWSALLPAKRGYRVYRGTSPGGENQYVEIVGGGNTNFGDDGAQSWTPGLPPGAGSAIGTEATGAAMSQQAWSPDGEWIYFGQPAVTSTNLNLFRLAKIHPDGTGLTEVVSSDAIYGIRPSGVTQWGPSVSPDGATLAWPQGDTIHLWDIDGSNLRSLTPISDASQVGGLCWSPDSTKIACGVRATDGNGGILVQAVADGSVELALTPSADTGSTWYYPTWMPFLRSAAGELSPGATRAGVVRLDATRVSG